MRSLLIVVMACFISTSAMANKTFNLDETFTFDMQDTCSLNDKKQVECTDEKGNVAATISFPGVVEERTNLTQVRLKEIANDPKLKEKSNASMKKRVSEWITRSGGKISPDWKEPIGDVLQMGELWVTYGATATAEGIFLMKNQIWYDGKAYEMNVVMNDGKANLAALMDALNTLRVKGH